MSTVHMELIDTSGRFLVTLGDEFATVMLGVGTIGLNDIDANIVNISIGNDNDVIVITVLQTSDRFEPGTETISIGNVSPSSVYAQTKPFELVVRGTKLTSEMRIYINGNTAFAPTKFISENDPGV